MWNYVAKKLLRVQYGLCLTQLMVFLTYQRIALKCQVKNSVPTMSFYAVIVSYFHEIYSDSIGGLALDKAMVALPVSSLASIPHSDSWLL